MIIQVNGQNTKVSIAGNNLIMESFQLEGVTLPRLVQDLTQFQVHEPRTLRLYAGLDGQYHYKDINNMYWLIAEGILPGHKYEQVATGELDQNGQPVRRLILIPPNLQNEMDLKVWALPTGGI